jgi:hypothetical protein
VVGHCAGFEQLYEERPGHAEQVRRALCGDNLIVEFDALIWPTLIF